MGREQETGSERPCQVAFERLKQIKRMSPKKKKKRALANHRTVPSWGEREKKKKKRGRYSDLVRGFQKGNGLSKAESSDVPGQMAVSSEVPHHVLQFATQGTSTAPGDGRLSGERARPAHTQGAGTPQAVRLTPADFPFLVEAECHQSLPVSQSIPCHHSPVCRTPGPWRGSPFSFTALALLQTLDWSKLHHISHESPLFYLPSVSFSQQNAYTRRPPEICQARVQEMEASGSLFAEELPGPA